MEDNMSARAQIQYRCQRADFEDGISAFLEGVQASFAAVARAVRKWRDREHLHRLPDHLLKDMGISRSEIEHAIAFGRQRDEGDGARLVRRCGPAE